MPTTSIFDKKIFNGEVFEGYIGRIPNPNKTELLKSRAIRPRPDLAVSMADQDGGNYITTTLTGLISGTVPTNYDGATNIVASNTDTYKHSRVVVGRAAAWTEKDFSYDITGGKDFLEEIAEQINDYWNEIYQGVLISILKGVFSMTGTAGTAFVNAHTTDITANGSGGCLEATTLNSAIQRACGDNKGKFSLAIMHSVVATNLENLNLISYLKYTDANGMQRDLALGSLNGKMVLIDDSMPTKTVNLGTTQAPNNQTAYITYVLGDGAIEYTDCGAKVPYEVERNAGTNGGQDTLYSRQRKCYAPYGISFTMASMSSLSPTDVELENGANWEIVNSQAASNKQYLPHKLIPIAQIISLG